MKPGPRHLLVWGGRLLSARAFALALVPALFASTAHAQVLRGSLDALPGADPDFLSPRALGPAPPSAFPPDPVEAEADSSPPPLAEIEVGERRRAVEDPEQEPFEQLGIRAGAFWLKPSLEVFGGYDSNPLAADDPEGSAFGRADARLDFESEWLRHELRGRLEAEYKAYEAFPDEDEPRYSGDIAARIDARRDLRIDLAARAELDTIQPGDPQSPTSATSDTQSLLAAASAGITYKPSRLSVGFLADAERLVYEDTELNSGLVIDNEDDNYTEAELRLRTGYELDPGLEPFVELSGNQRDYDLRTNDAGVLHDSKGYKVYAGVRVEPDPIWAFEGKLGYGYQEAEDPSISAIDGLIARGSLIWEPSALTRVTLTAEKDVAATGIECCAVADQLRGSIEIEHDLRRYLTITAKLDWEQSSHDRIDYTFASTEAELGLEYKFSRSVSAKARVAYERLDSDIASEEYDATLVELGVRLQR